MIILEKNLKKIHGLGLSKSKMVSKILSLDEVEYSKLNDKKNLNYINLFQIMLKLVYYYKNIKMII